MDARRCAERKAAIAALSEFFHSTSRSFSRPGSRVESLRCQVETHAERLAFVAGLAGQGRGTLAEVETVLGDLRELGVFADNRLLRDVYAVYGHRDRRAA